MALELEELTGQIIGAAIEVHKALGPGFLEAIYENALVHELRKRGLKVEQQVEVAVLYDSVEVGKHRLDLFVEGQVVVDLKTVTDFAAIHFSVVRSQLRSVHSKHGLLLNFAKFKLDAKRVIAEERSEK